MLQTIARSMTTIRDSKGDSGESLQDTETCVTLHSLTHPQCLPIGEKLANELTDQVGNDLFNK